MAPATRASSVPTSAIPGTLATADAIVAGTAVMPPRRGPGELTRKRVVVLLWAAGFVAFEVVAGTVGFRIAQRHLVVDVPEQASTVEHATRDGVVSLHAPRAFADVTGRLPAERNAALVLEDARATARVYVEDIEKRQVGRVATLTQVANAWRRSARALRNVHFGRPEDVQFAGRASVQFEFDGIDDESRSIRGVIVIVDGDGYYHFLAAWSAAPRFPIEESRLRAILDSARLHL